MLTMLRRDHFSLIRQAIYKDLQLITRKHSKER